MRRWTTLAFAVSISMLATSAFAADISPKDVAFGDDGVTESLTGKPGDPAHGAEVFKSRKLGNCLACHANEEMAGELFHGTVGGQPFTVHTSHEHAIPEGSAWLDLEKSPVLMFDGATGARL